MTINKWVSGTSLAIAGITAVTGLTTLSAQLERDSNRTETDQIARDRYSNNCLQFKDSRDRPVAINPNLILTDPAGNPLAPGTPVCDSFGMTGVVGQDGKPQDLAVVTDWEIYRQEKGTRTFDFQRQYETTYRNTNKGR